MLVNYKIMKDIYPFLKKFLRAKQRFAMATVISTWGSAPRPVGSVMLIAEDGTMAGSVSGGCVEGAVAKNALQVLASNKPLLLNFGVTDDEAWQVGLSCGGSIQVFIEPYVAFLDKKMDKILRGCLEKNIGGILLTKLNNEDNLHHFVTVNESLDVDNVLNAHALRAYNERKTQVLELENGDKWFVRVVPPKPKLIIVGAAHITVDLVHLAHYFDFETVVIDPRGIFAHKTDFPTPPHHLHADWPAETLPHLTLDAYTYAVLLTHDPKIDDQALHILLPSDIAYIGCLGSKKTHEKRVKRLTEAGNRAEDIAKINAPIGVDIRAKSAKEIALSIIAELIKVKNQFL
jgi:xanthine dehydrogenase accessory factor